MKDPFFSIVTPSYNHGAFIRDNIESVLAQGYAQFEHIIMDGGSQDETAAILREYPHLIWKSEKDRGQSDAINKAITLSRGEWILWVNSDDYLLEGALRRFAEFIQAHPDVELIYSNIVFVDKQKTILSITPPNYSRRMMKYWWRHSLRLWQPGTIFTRALYNRVGPLDITCRYAMDFDFFLRAHLDNDFVALDASQVAFRRHEDQVGSGRGYGFVPYYMEAMRITRSFWAKHDKIFSFYLQWASYFITQNLLFIEGLRQIREDSIRSGIRLCAVSVLKNPFCVIRKEHLGFWIRIAIGEKRFQAIRNQWS